jgi:hypothetical protein
VARGPGPHLLAELSSGAATCSSTSNLASLLRWAPALSCVPWLRALPPQEESSGVATCFSAPNLTFLPRWVSALPRGPGLACPSGELRCCHIPTAPNELWTTGIKKVKIGRYLSVGDFTVYIFNQINFSWFSLNSADFLKNRCDCLTF